MAMMLDNGKILSSALESILLNKKQSTNDDFCVITMDNALGQAVRSSLSAWDGISIVLADSPELYKLALALGVVPAPDEGNVTDKKPGYLVMSERFFLNNFARDYRSFLAASNMKPDNEEMQIESRNDYANTKFGCSIVHDFTTDKRFTKQRCYSSPTKQGWSYKGKLPIVAQRILLESIAIKDANRFYQSDVFVHNKLTGTTMITRYDRASALMSALTIGNDCPAYPDISDSSPWRKWRQSMMDSFLVDADYDIDPSLSSIVEAYRFYANLSVLWEELVKDEIVKLVVDGNTLRAKSNKIADGFKKLSAALGAGSYVDAYISGVPLDDIFA